MPIPDPWDSPDPGCAQESESDSTRPPAHEHAHARARETATKPSDTAEHGGEVVPFPGADRPENTDGDRAAEIELTDEAPSAATSRWRSAAATWVTEARETATAAVDGSVWRARPPSLRDLHTRARRAEWAGDIPALRAAGQWFGYASLAITAVGYALLWIARRPSRLVLTALITVLVVALAT